MTLKTHYLLKSRVQQRGEQHARCRTILIEWLMEMESMLTIPKGALFFAVAILDAYDALAGFDRSTYQLRGIVCLVHLGAACLFGVWMPPSDAACAFFATEYGADAVEHVRACRESDNTRIGWTTGV